MYIIVVGGAAFGALADGRLEHVDGDAGRADRVQPLALVPLGPQRIEHPRDHGRDLVAPLGDLGDDDVGVVAVRGGDEGVSALDPRRDQRLGLEAGADGELTAEVLPTLLEADLEPGVGLGVLVETGDFVPFAEHRAGDGGADAPAANDQNEHRPDTSALLDGAYLRPRSLACRARHAPCVLDLLVQKRTRRFQGVQ